MQRSFSWLAAFGAVTVLLTALLAPTTATAQTITEDYGSIAYSPSTGVVAAGQGFTQEGAKMASLYQCVTHGGAADCWAVNWYYDAVGSFATSSNGDYGSGEGWADDITDATSNADHYAKKSCQQEGGTNCQVVFRGYTAYVSSTGTGGAYYQLPGLLIPVSAGTTVPAGKYYAAGGTDFSTAKCISGLAAFGIAAVVTDGVVVELSVAGVTEIVNAIADVCGEFVLSQLVSG